MKRNHPFIIVFVGMLLMLLATACNFNSQPASKPVVKINVAPEQLVVGQVVSIQAIAVDTTGVARVDVQVDGQPLASLPATPAQSTFIATQTWTPAIPGSHVIQAQAVNVDNLPGEMVSLIVQVGEAVSETPPEPAVEEVLQVEPVLSDVDVIEASTGDTVEPVAPAAVTDSPPASQLPAIIALTNLNVRTGPGLEYPAIGQLLADESALVTGRNPEGTWFEIIYPTNSNARGWVSASETYVKHINTGVVPVTAVPLPPTPTATALPPTATPVPPTATPTSTPLPPTATPAPNKPIIHYFGASQYSITAGASVELQWDLSNAQVAYLLYDGNTLGVTAPGGKTVSPAVSTVYTLVAINEAGDTSLTIEVTVNPAPDPGDPPVFDPGIVIPLFPTPTPTPFKIVPGVIVPKPTVQLVPGFKVSP